MAGRRFIVALTGASGAAYGRRLVESLAGTGALVHLVVSDAAAKIAVHELGPAPGEERSNVIRHAPGDLEVPIASGSYRHDGMAVCPCSMGTLGRIAGGISSNLIERAADVCLKERRRLVLVPRETPLSEIHLENMLRVTRAGAVVLPASPGFYGREVTVGRLVDFVVSRVLDQLGVENTLADRYAGPARHPENL